VFAVDEEVDTIQADCCCKVVGGNLPMNGKFTIFKAKGLSRYVVGECTYMENLFN
jgi:hypothetical protein